ncbi:TRAP transporter small permease [Comamonas composti]|uniref:TRAP transporter small permease n=1 Tax=Comamonas composti TaxID=408558 RepID=UPI0009FD6E99|nr:TRAP transporter small permease [Comamonas composti]
MSENTKTCPAQGNPSKPGPQRPARSLEEHFGAIVLMALVLITLVNVLVRYFSDQSFAWTEEISVFLLVVLTLAGSAVAAARDDHIRIGFFYERVGPLMRKRLVWLTTLATVAMFMLLALLMLRTGWQEYVFEETTSGLGVPRWWYTVWLPPLAALIALRSWRARRVHAASAAPVEASQESGV